MTRASFQQMFLNTATVVVTLLAGVVGYARLHEILSPRVGDGARTSIVTDWRKYAAAGVRLGPDGARVTIIEFSDFQCPFCRVASGDLDDLQQWYGHDLAVVYRNFPIHPFAHSAAVAAECAAGMGAFEALDHRFFAVQDSIGTKSWASFALESGVRDTVPFVKCMHSPPMDSLVREDSLAARRLGIDATPTFLIDSLLVPGNPGFERLNAYVKAVLRRP